MIERLRENGERHVFEPGKGHCNYILTDKPAGRFQLTSTAPRELQTFFLRILRPLPHYSFEQYPNRKTSQRGCGNVHAAPLPFS
jgi:hypothetical protein